MEEFNKKIEEHKTNNDKCNKGKNNNVKAEKKLLKILMIHGYRQNETSFRERSGSLRKSLKNFADFVFCQAPHIIPKQNEENNLSDLNLQEETGWWFSAFDKSYNALDITDCDTGFNETLEYINSVFEKEGPFHGIFAFSQGACLGSILSQISSTNYEKYNFIRFKFAILIAGFKSGQQMHDVYYDLDNKINMPSLHLIGTGDKVIPSNMALNLTNYFVDPKVHMHDGGHFIPVNAESKKSYVDFLTEMSKIIFE